MIKTITALVTTLVMALTFSGCSEDTQHRVVHPQQQYYEQQQVQHVYHDNSGSDMVTGIVAGALLSNVLSNNSGSSSYTTVNKTYINKTYSSPTPQTSTGGTKYS